MIQASTIGYTGFEIADFVAVLQSHGVGCLVDIRELPQSRKRGFSKSSLCEAVEHGGIDYLHLRELGSPRALRHAVRADGDYATFFRGMRQHLATPLARDSIETVVQRMRHQHCCLMCCCADWSFCHRQVVVAAISRKLAIGFDHVTRRDDGEPNRKAA